MRRRAKTANFGIIYGISAWGLAERLHISRKEGKELIDGYFDLYPGVKKYMEESVEKARKKRICRNNYGPQTLPPGHKLPECRSQRDGGTKCHQAPIQGSAADIIKMAMICIQKRIQEEG